jgi:hypothetical protein
MSAKKLYYFLIALVALFFLSWGVADICSLAFGTISGRLVSASASAPVFSSELGNDPSLDVYYQKKLVYDRLADSLGRVLVAGLIFWYSRQQAEKAGS